MYYQISQGIRIYSDYVYPSSFLSGSYNIPECPDSSNTSADAETFPDITEGVMGEFQVPLCVRGTQDFGYFFFSVFNNKVWACAVYE